MTWIPYAVFGCSAFTFALVASLATSVFAMGPGPAHPPARFVIAAVSASVAVGFAMAATVRSARRVMSR